MLFLLIFYLILFKLVSAQFSLFSSFPILYHLSEYNFANDNTRWYKILPERWVIWRKCLKVRSERSLFCQLIRLLVSPWKQRRRSRLKCVWRNRMSDENGAEKVRLLLQKLKTSRAHISSTVWSSSTERLFLLNEIHKQKKGNYLGGNYYVAVWLFQEYNYVIRSLLFENSLWALSS